MIAVAVFGAVVVVVVSLHDRGRQDLRVDAGAALIDRLPTQEGCADQKRAGHDATRERNGRGRLCALPPARQRDQREQNQRCAREGEMGVHLLVCRLGVRRHREVGNRACGRSHNPRNHACDKQARSDAGQRVPGANPRDQIDEQPAEQKSDRKMHQCGMKLPGMHILLLISWTMREARSSRAGRKGRLSGRCGRRGTAERSRSHSRSDTGRAPRRARRDSAHAGATRACAPFDAVSPGACGSASASTGRRPSPRRACAHVALLRVCVPADAPCSAARAAARARHSAPDDIDSDHQARSTAGRTPVLPGPASRLRWRFRSIFCRSWVTSSPVLTRGGRPHSRLTSRPTDITLPAMVPVEWTCPMHPQIVRSGPGSCPICGMALEPRTATLGEERNPELVDMTRRFWVGLVLTIPLVLLAMSDLVPALAHAIPAKIRTWIELALATPVVLWAGLPFFERGWASIRNRSLNMFTLIAIGTGTAYVYS